MMEIVNIEFMNLQPAYFHQISKFIQTSTFAGKQIIFCSKYNKKNVKNLFNCNKHDCAVIFYRYISIVL